MKRNLKFLAMQHFLTMSFAPQDFQTDSNCVLCVGEVRLVGTVIMLTNYCN